MDFIELAKQRERTRKINSITDKVVKGNVLWASENISEGNLIVYAPNASGKTTLSNVIAGNEAHFHSRYVEYIDEDKVPNMVLFSKAKKFSYKDINSYNKIIKDSTRIYSNKFSLEDMVMEINGCLRRYGGSAAFLEKEFLMSLNEENINEAKENFSESLMGWTDRQEYYDLSYGVRPYTYINYNFERSNKHFFNYLKSTKTDPSINGDGAYIKGLISSTDGNKNAINGIYLMILILSQFPDEVSKMTELNMGLLINKRGVAVNKTVYKDELLDKITEQLQSLKIIDSATSVKQIKNKLIIFSKSGRNITRSVFSKISDGQSNLLSLVFFTEMNVLNKEDIIFDDPFDALDRKNSYQVLKTIKRFEKKKKIIILTHDLNSLEMMQTYLAAD